jgi:hypothetical protein
MTRMAAIIVRRESGKNVPGHFGGRSMSACSIPVDLVRTARIVVDTVARNFSNNGSAVYSALLASQLYESIKVELKRAPRHEPATIGTLSAALDQCRNAAVHVDQPALMEGELRAAAEILETGMLANAGRSRPATRPRFTVIEGGLKTAKAG